MKIISFVQRCEIGTAMAPWNGVCPACGGVDFIEGPHGGDNINVTCVTCDLRLNTYNKHGFLMAARIGK